MTMSSYSVKVPGSGKSWEELEKEMEELKRKAELEKEVIREEFLKGKTLTAKNKKRATFALPAGIVIMLLCVCVWGYPIFACFLAGLLIAVTAFMYLSEKPSND